MKKREMMACLFVLVLLTAWAASAFGQTRPMLTFRVKTADGVAVANADLSVQPAQAAKSVIASVQGRPANKFGLHTRPYQPFFVTKTNAAGEAQAPKAGFENALPADKVLVKVRVAGYELYQQTVELAEVKPVEIVLRPLPPQQ
jgi:hypothetical protein